MKLSSRGLYENLRQTAYTSLLELATDEGINASSKEEIYGCVFGRDTAVTTLKVLRALSKKPNREDIDAHKLLQICRRSLLTLVNLRGKSTNIQSGEQPGKFIHEFRRSNYELIFQKYGPRYIYPDGTMRNFDSIDSTPLGLIAIYRYWELTQDAPFLFKALPAVEEGLNWMITYGDTDKDTLIEYDFPPERTTSGSLIQSWTDSPQALLRTDGTLPPYPIASMEVQGYKWLALKLWADFYKRNDQTNTTQTRTFADILLTRASRLKKRFNESFIMEDQGYFFPAQALDGQKNMIHTVTGNALLLLWATYQNKNFRECILEDKYIPSMVKRSFLPDLFDPEAGIRTMSTLSPTYNPNQDSYHNGSFWPKLNGMAHEGLQNWSYNSHAQILNTASIKPIAHFGTPIELYIKDANGNYLEWKSSNGHSSCKTQAWSAAVLLDFTI